jgi:hypothetical protein
MKIRLIRRDHFAGRVGQSPVPAVSGSLRAWKLNPAVGDPLSRRGILLSLLDDRRFYS